MPALPKILFLLRASLSTSCDRRRVLDPLESPSPGKDPKFRYSPSPRVFFGTFILTKERKRWDFCLRGSDIYAPFFMFCRGFQSAIRASLTGAPRSCLSSGSRISFGVSSAHLRPLRRERMKVGDSVDRIEGAERLPREAKEILHRLASEWSGTADSRALQVVRMKGAMTNEVYQVNWIDQSRKVLVRIYGEGVGVFFNRDDEIRTFECMSRHEQGPRLLGRFSNGRVEEFIHARTLSAVDLRDPEISSLIASKLREFHDLDMPGPRKVFLWERLRKWLKEARRLCSTEESKEFRLAALEVEISKLEKALTSEDKKIGFCHNDLQYGNIMMDEASRQVTLIDYEYASFNPVAYDIANHFCEMAADYHTETPHVLDFSKYPDREERTRFIRAYLNFSDRTSKEEEEVGKLDMQIEKYAIASHLLWGLWGIISAHVNEINFDYLAYARQRFQQYELMKWSLCSE